MSGFFHPLPFLALIEMSQSASKLWEVIKKSVTFPGSIFIEHF